MAGAMKRFCIPVLVGLLAVSCSSGEEGSSVSLDLEDQGAEGIQIPVDPQPEVQPQEPVRNEPTPQSASAPGPNSSTEALLMLDTWHRAMANHRTDVAAGSSREAVALRDFAQIWSGGAATYRARLDVAPVTVFGPEFEGYSKALAQDGAEGLARALKRGNSRGPAYLAWTEAMVQLAINQQDLTVAGRATGVLLSGMLAAGYDRQRVLELQTVSTSLGAQVSTFLPAEDYTVEAGSNYSLICKSFREQGINNTWGWIAEFNGKASSSLRENEQLRIPTATLELKAWRQARVAALYADGIPIRIYPISVGTSDAPTPVREFTLHILLEDPMWYPPGGGAIPHGNPDNPLGARWLGFKEDTTYAFHGTNSEDTIGSFETRGCIRMHNEDVKALYKLVGPGISVKINP
jgi:hypothetical protein